METHHTIPCLYFDTTICFCLGSWPLKPLGSSPNPDLWLLSLSKVGPHSPSATSSRTRYITPTAHLSQHSTVHVVWDRPMRDSCVTVLFPRGEGPLPRARLVRTPAAAASLAVSPVVCAKKKRTFWICKVNSPSLPVLLPAGLTSGFRRKHTRDERGSKSRL